MTAIIKIDNLSKKFGKQVILDDITIELNTPGIYALVGPNGSGKSTLMNIMMNLLAADEGSVQMLGLSNQNKELMNRVSFLKDNTVLYPYLTGYDHLQYAAQCYKISKEQIQQVGEQIGITDYWHKKTGNYSLGMKQHLLIALAILNNPELIILDEPLNGLDPTSVIRVRNLILSLKEQGKTLLMSSHTLSEVDAVTNDILFLKDGKLLQEKLEKSDMQQISSEDRYRQLYHEAITSESGR